MFIYFFMSFFYFANSFADAVSVVAGGRRIFPNKKKTQNKTDLPISNCRGITQLLKSQHTSMEITPIMDTHL